MSTRSLQQAKADKALVRKHFPKDRAVVQRDGDSNWFSILNMGITGSGANSTTEAMAWCYAAQAVQRKLDRDAKPRDSW